MTARGLTLIRLIAQAYGLEESRVADGPAWAGNDRYDIDAKAENPVAHEQMMLMLRSLLSDRFQLKFHRENRVRPQSVLVLARNGPKFGPQFHRAQDGAAIPAAKPGPGQTALKGYSMEHFAFFLSDNRSMWDPEGEDGTGLPVIDQTGLQGVYDVILSQAPRRDWLSVLEQELGLKLELRKISSDTIVIDSAVKPAAN